MRRFARLSIIWRLAQEGTQFTCFTGTKVQILTPEELLLQPFSTFASLFFSNPLYDKTRKLPIFITIGTSVCV
jgi:hypothetical protein